MRVEQFLLLFTEYTEAMKGCQMPFASRGSEPGSQQQSMYMVKEGEASYEQGRVGQEHLLSSKVCLVQPTGGTVPQPCNPVSRTLAWLGMEM